MRLEPGFTRGPADDYHGVWGTKSPVMEKPMILRPLSRLLSLTALLLAVICCGPDSRAHTQGQEISLEVKREDKPTVRFVKYAEPAMMVRQNAGRVVVVNFWSSACVPCKRLFPRLVGMSQKYAGLGLVVLTVNVDADAWQKETQDGVLQFLRAQKATFTNFMLNEPEIFLEKAGIEYLPCVFGFSREGTLRKFTADAAGPEDIEKQVAQWLKRN
jgi:thiol-disulfide isomerase/thioredoxin